ncbi:MAG: 23S rRNA (pseudouridine(1915)-N(3))-methyltransferase RlmH [Ezakiella sp.]|nr:23S rRNA (pseudouridine(1915)-N(3))-methyltransferase RlmH [Ezakiella sp.]MDD7472491.1 23S rRNA (pseudouridine(1915)-N(3))-methyltransferase RlmH [Bacillota bacterium]
MIEIIATGKIPKEYRVLIDDFIKKISPYEKMVLTLFDEVKLKSDDSNLEEKLKTETKRAIERAKGKIIFLDADAKNPNSEEFKNIIETSKNVGVTISFVIGGSYGFDHKMIQSYQKISLGRMTLLHHMATLFLCEAIYRSYKMMQNGSYNK